MGQDVNNVVHADKNTMKESAHCVRRKLMYLQHFKLTAGHVSVDYEILNRLQATYKSHQPQYASTPSVYKYFLASELQGKQKANESLS